MTFKVLLTLLVSSVLFANEPEFKMTDKSCKIVGTKTDSSSVITENGDNLIYQCKFIELKSEVTCKVFKKNQKKELTNLRIKLREKISENKFLFHSEMENLFLSTDFTKKEYRLSTTVLTLDGVLINKNCYGRIDGR